MLHLKRIVNPYEWERCKISKEYITYGDYYYVDDEDGLVIKKSVYDRLKKQKKYEEFDYSRLNNAQSEREYEQVMREKEREFLTDSIFERKVNKGVF